LSFYNRCDILTNLQLIDEGEAWCPDMIRRQFQEYWSIFIVDFVMAISLTSINIISDLSYIQKATINNCSQQASTVVWYNETCLNQSLNKPESWIKASGFAFGCISL
jgi:hypothetical protein